MFGSKHVNHNLKCLTICPNMQFVKLAAFESIPINQVRNVYGFINRNYQLKEHYVNTNVNNNAVFNVV